MTFQTLIWMLMTVLLRMNFEPTTSLYGYYRGTFFFTSHLRLVLFSKKMLSYSLTVIAFLEQNLEWYQH